MRIVSSSPKITEKIASLFAGEILKTSSKNGFLIGLRGNLGSGKSVFARGFAKGLGIRKRILSPTFPIMKIYELRKRNYHAFVHIDAYRIKKVSELETIGFKDVIREKSHISLIEWADKIKKILPKEMIWIDFQHSKKENERMVKITNRPLI